LNFWANFLCDLGESALTPRTTAPLFSNAANESRNPQASLVQVKNHVLPSQIRQRNGFAVLIHRFEIGRLVPFFEREL
jgi:hypothetical protein